MRSYKPAHPFFRRPQAVNSPYLNRLPSLSVISRGMPFGRSGSSGSSGFVGGFRRLRLSNRELVLKARRNPGRCRYRYTCRPVGFLAVNGCRPKQSGFGFRGRYRLNHAGMTFLKLLRLSDGLCLFKAFIFYHTNRAPRDRSRQCLFPAFPLPAQCSFGRTRARADSLAYRCRQKNARLE